MRGLRFDREYGTARSLKYTDGVILMSGKDAINILDKIIEREDEVSANLGFDLGTLIKFGNDWRGLHLRAEHHKPRKNPSCLCNGDYEIFWQEGSISKNEPSPVLDPLDWLDITVSIPNWREFFDVGDASSWYVEDYECYRCNGSGIGFYLRKNSKLPESPADHAEYIKRYGSTPFTMARTKGYEMVNGAFLNANEVFGWADIGEFFIRYLSLCNNSGIFNRPFPVLSYSTINRFISEKEWLKFDRKESFFAYLLMKWATLDESDERHFRQWLPCILDDVKSARIMEQLATMPEQSFSIPQLMKLAEYDVDPQLVDAMLGGK